MYHHFFLILSQIKILCDIANCLFNSSSGMLNSFTTAYDISTVILNIDVHVSMISWNNNWMLYYSLFNKRPESLWETRKILIPIKVVTCSHLFLELWQLALKVFLNPDNLWSFALAVNINLPLLNATLLKSY